MVEFKIINEFFSIPSKFLHSKHSESNYLTPRNFDSNNLPQLLKRHWKKIVEQFTSIAQRKK